MAKASNENGSDGEERKLGEQTGLDIKNSANFWTLLFAKYERFFVFANKIHCEEFLSNQNF